MLKIRRFTVYPGLAAILLAGLAPAAALAAAAGPAAAPQSCTGPVFSNVKLQNQASRGYLAQSTSGSDAVLYSASNQTWDGYRDPAGHLIIYRCGTNNVLTD